MQNEKEKKMNRIFDMNNGFFRGLSKLVDCIYLSVLFVFSSIPIFTIGASLTALYYTIQKTIKNDRGYVGKEYWAAWRSNFKQSTLIWLINLLMLIVLYGDIQILKVLEEGGNPLGKAYVLFGVMLVLLLLWISYLYPYIARFENTTKAILKNAAYMAILNLPRTLLIGLLMLVFGLAIYLVPITILIVPAVYTWLKNYNLEKVFRKYMSEEDIAAEEELNREYKN